MTRDHPGLGWALNPKTSVLTRGKREKTQQKRTHRAEGPVKSQAEMGVWQLQAKGHLEPPESGRG